MYFKLMRHFFAKRTGVFINIDYLTHHHATCVYTPKTHLLGGWGTIP